MTAWSLMCASKCGTNGKCGFDVAYLGIMSLLSRINTIITSRGGMSAIKSHPQFRKSIRVGTIQFHARNGGDCVIFAACR